MTDDTTTDRETVRPATECWLVHDGHWFATSMLRADEIVPGDGDVLALAIDNVTGGGLVARVREAVDGVVQRSVPTQYAPSEGDLCWLADDLVAAVTRALGVQP